jgi:hypothetical protein
VTLSSRSPLQAVAAPAEDSAPTAGYVIWCCDYTPNSAGIGCLYRLCDELNWLGYPAFMTGGERTASHLNAPIVSGQRAQELCAHGYIAVYPESISGNPLEAHTVVRWVLNRPGLLGGDDVYAESELVYSYSDVFSRYIQNAVAGKLYMPTIDETIFYAQEHPSAPRSLDCYYLGKSTWKDGFVDRGRAFEITRDAPAKKELGKLFRAARVLYSFDNSTILIYEAMLCGCPVVIIPDGTQTKEDYARLELGLNGIAWGPEEFTGLPIDVAGLRQRYDNVKRQFAADLQQMIDRSQAEHRRKLPEVKAALARRTKVWVKANPLTAAVRGVKKTLRRGREIERTVRVWRKRAVARIKQYLAEQGNPYVIPPDPNWQLSRRLLDCLYVGESAWQAGFVERDRTFEISPHMAKAQLRTLFRVTRAFYCFDDSTPLIELALQCGSRVVTIDKNGQQRELFGAPRKLPDSSRMAAEGTTRAA